MLGFIFLETVCAALARNKDEPEEQAETDEGKESLESHYGARHLLIDYYHSLVIDDLRQEILVTLAASTVMVGGLTLSETNKTYLD